jgi:hypothetical protein
MMSGVVGDREQRWLADWGSHTGGDLVVKGQVGARSGIDQKGRDDHRSRRRRLDDRDS